ncbi:MAG TPA: hypothetical protein VF166_07650, partial [Gemmatimonadaceae bacterium]
MTATGYGVVSGARRIPFTICRIMVSARVGAPARGANGNVLAVGWNAMSKWPVNEDRVQVSGGSV